MPIGKQAAEVVIRPLNLMTVFIPIVGKTPYISHKWSEKAKSLMLDKQMGKAAGKKERKDPKRDYEESMYRDAKGHPSIPGGAFKAAIVSACRQIDGLPMTKAKQAIHVDGELFPIKGRPSMRQDMVRLETGVADIRFRAEFKIWSTVIRVTFDADMLSLEQLINLVNRAGQVGVGEWRPSSPKSSSGDYGMFHIPPGAKITPAKRKE